MRLFLLTVIALGCFASNSLLCRGALRTGAIDAASFTFLRLFSGALFLTFYLKLIKGEKVYGQTDWVSALALVGYAVFFSLSYINIDAGIGAFLLFGSVQVTMIGWGLLNKSSPSMTEFFGLIVALAGLALFTVPEQTRPDTTAAMFMVLAGGCWGVYSLTGKSVQSPIRSNTRNFLLSLPLALLFSLFTFRSIHLTSKGILLASISGMTSGVAYTIWYTILPSLGMTRAAIIQLSVPVLALATAIPLLGERPALMSLFAGVLTLSGVGISFLRKRKCENILE